MCPNPRVRPEIETRSVIQGYGWLTEIRGEPKAREIPAEEPWKGNNSLNIFKLEPPYILKGSQYKVTLNYFRILYLNTQY